jgi:hypothetical protein
VHSAYAHILRATLASETHPVIHKTENIQTVQKSIERRDKPKNHKTPFDTTTQYRQENEIEFMSKNQRIEN